MSYIIRLPQELGREIESRRTAAGLSITEVAAKAGKSRAVVYRLERGQESSVTSLLAVLGALGISMRLETAALPSLKDTAGFFSDDDEEDGRPDATP